MTVSLCIIAYNEEAALPRLLEQVLAQTYPGNKTEIVLVDSGSSDGTRELMDGFARDRGSAFLGITVLDNPRRNQAAGWNTAISSARGDIIIRVDAHAEIPEDFIEQNVLLIESGEDVCGGARPSKLDSPTPMKEMLLLAESSMFGSSPAGYRRKSGEKKYVSSVFHGAYRRSVFESVGGFNEDLGRTEDNELHYRIRKDGYRICQGSDIISYQHVRGSLGSMLAQKFGNGKWIGLTMGVCYQCISSFHFVPFFFVLALFCSLLLFVSAFITGNLWMAWPFIFVFGTYILADIMMSAASAASAERKHFSYFLLPAVFFMLHVSYGAGTVVGLVQIPFWKHMLKKNAKLNGFTAKDRIEQVRQCVTANSAKGRPDGSEQSVPSASVSDGRSGQSAAEGSGENDTDTDKSDNQISGRTHEEVTE